MMFGADYNNSDFKITFSLVVFTSSIILFKSGLARVLAANNLMWWGFLSNAFWAGVLIVSAKYFVHLGAIGLAFAYALAYLLNTIIFVPFYYSRKLVPMSTLLSKESAVIWGIVVLLVLLNAFDVQLVCRGIVFLPCMFMVLMSFKNLVSFQNNSVI